MPRVIFKCPYLKGGSERAASHLHNYVRYMATREGAQHMAIGHEQLPATEEQRKMVAQLLREFPLSRGLFEYEDYQTAPTRGNASEFITRALEDNYDQIAKRDNYVSYIASRPRAQRAGAHALFTGSDAPLVLSQIAAEVAHHPGNVWLPIISLRREDAARLGYDDAGQWKNLIAGYAMKETPQEQAQKRHLRVAAYCRVSTNSKEQLTSYENQLAYYTEKIMKNPSWTMVKVFADEGKTGTSTCKRKEFLQMIRMCRQGKIDMILAKAVSRFARNTVDTLNYTRELRELGIPVIFEEQNINSIYPESEFLIAIHGAFAQSESENTSANVRWGKRRSMKAGHVTMQYKWMLGYEKGPDGRPVINEEQAETVRFIYQRYLAGDTLRAIKSKLEAQGALNAIGKQEWTIKNLLSILSNEKYCGDALLQKTFIQDCISKKVIQNNGQLPKYLVQDHHEGIVSRDVFYAAQLEIARRRAQTGGTSKSAPTGRSKYSGKYILTNLMFCGHCGTGYRRCVWNKGGVKRAVWRCGSRLDYGAKYCKHSETLEEKPLQQAILNAINSVMDSRDALEVQLMGAMEQELAPIPGETMSLADIDRMLEELEKQFNSLLAEASAAGGTEDYAERFRMISNAMADLKEHKSRIKQVYQENELVSQRLKAASIAMSAYAAELTEWDQSVVYQLVEKVTVLAKDKIRVTFRNGTEVEQEIEQLDWRNAS